MSKRTQIRIPPALRTRTAKQWIELICKLIGTAPKWRRDRPSEAIPETITVPLWLNRRLAQWARFNWRGQSVQSAVVKAIVAHELEQGDNPGLMYWAFRRGHLPVKYALQAASVYGAEATMRMGLILEQGHLNGAKTIAIRCDYRSTPHKSLKISNLRTSAPRRKHQTFDVKITCYR